MNWLWLVRRRKDQAIGQALAGSDFVVEAEREIGGEKVIFLADTSMDLEKVKVEIDREVGQLMTPLSCRKDQGVKFGIDNGAFAKFSAPAFISLLDRHKDAKDRCLFVACPDIVADARRTLEAFEYWFPKLSGWPIALVAQDGLENLPIPWNHISAIFIGGSTEWKLSPEASAIVKCAKIMDKWVHVGRINSGLRLEYFTALGADSFDGTGVSKYSHMRRAIGNNQYLFDEPAATVKLALRFQAPSGN